jgi:hypothetical protein
LPVFANGGWEMPLSHQAGSLWAWKIPLPQPLPRARERGERDGAVSMGRGAAWRG